MNTHQLQGIIFFFWFCPWSFIRSGTVLHVSYPYVSYPKRLRISGSRSAVFVPSWRVTAPLRATKNLVRKFHLNQHNANTIKKQLGQTLRANCAAAC
jgi:hypothetical protein